MGAAVRMLYFSMLFYVLLNDPAYHVPAVNGRGLIRRSVYNDEGTPLDFHKHFDSPSLTP